ncbi:tetratricopeptide repeat protein [Pelagicoccus sp. SDUM812002]|nr:tetratricopeptide repeat protein [Pelagicoccus sp. SDUM812002]
MTSPFSEGQAYFDLGYKLQSDDAFKKSFLGSYGVNSENEPSISEVESVVLEKVSKMFEVNTAYAQRMLETLVTDEAGVSATFNYLLANLYFENEEYLLAETEYKKAIEKFPSFQRAWNNLGVLLMRGEDTEQAMKAFSRSIELGDTSAGTYGRLAYCHYELKNFLSAEAAYTQAILHDPRNPQWLEGKVEVYMASERFEQAALMIDELITRYPGAPNYWLAQSNAYLALDKNKLAARNLEVVHKMGKAGSNELYQLGRLYSLLGFGELAFRRFELTDRLNERYLLESALVLQDRGETSTATSILNLLKKPVEEMSPEDSSLYFRLQASLATNSGDSEKAIEYWERAREQDPLNGEHLLRLAALYLKQQQREKAYLLAERAEQDERTTFQALLTRSKLLVEDRKYSEAQQLLSKALQLQSSESLQNLYTRVVEASAQTR